VPFIVLKILAGHSQKLLKRKYKKKKEDRSRKDKDLE